MCCMQHLCRGKYLQPAHLSSITITITVASSTLRREVSRLGLLPVGLRSEACDLPVLLFHSVFPPVDSCARLPQTHAVWHPQLAGSCTPSETTAACVFTTSSSASYPPSLPYFFLTGSGVWETKGDYYTSGIFVLPLLTKAFF